MLSAKPTSSRLLALDAMRFIAACGVVWIHTAAAESSIPSIGVARFAVPFFTIASVWLLGESLRRKPDTRFRDYAWRRAKLLYGAFLLWNLIYLLARATKHKIFHQGMPLGFHQSLLWSGSSLQLWFLPFLLLALLLAFPLLKAGTNNRRAAIVLLITSLAAAVASSFLPGPPEHWDLGNAHFVRCTRDALPAVFLGIAAGLVFPGIRSAIETRAGLVAGLVLAIGASYAVVRFGRHPGLEAIAGLGAMMLAWQKTESSAVRALARLGVYAFGIYLAHSLFVEFLQAVATRSNVSISPMLDVVIAIAAIGLSLAVSRVLRSTPLIPA